MQSNEIDQLAAALSKAQALIEESTKDGKNSHLKSRYSTLTSVWEACKNALGKNDLAVVQTFTLPPEGYDLCLKTTLLHKSGQWIEGVLPMIAAQKTPQGFGSIGTYARRYSLAAIVGVCPEDDDAESGMQRQQTVKPSGVTIGTRREQNGEEHVYTETGWQRTEETKNKIKEQIDSFRALRVAGKLTVKEAEKIINQTLSANMTLSEITRCVQLLVDFLERRESGNLEAHEVKVLTEGEAA